jgi:hypothetical protein
MFEIFALFKLSNVALHCVSWRPVTISVAKPRDLTYWYKLSAWGNAAAEAFRTLEYECVYLCVKEECVKMKRESMNCAHPLVPERVNVAKILSEDFRVVAKKSLINIKHDCIALRIMQEEKVRAQNICSVK